MKKEFKIYESYSEFLNENKVTFTIDDGDLDDVFMDSRLSKNLDYKEIDGDTYYVLSKREYSMLVDMADSKGFDTEEIFDVIDESKTNQSKDINEGTTPTFKALIKRSKTLELETVSELEDLIADEFIDVDPFITGADFEIAKKKLRLSESVTESIDSKVRSKIVVFLKKKGFKNTIDYTYDTGQFIANDKDTAEDIIDAIEGKFKGKAYYDKETKNGEIPMMIV